MSGLICPDCRMFDIESFSNDKGKKMNKCTFCGWQGDPLPRIALSSHQLHSYRDEQREMQKQKQEGTLCFIRLYVEDPEKFEDDLDGIEDLMDLLEIDTLDGPYHDPPYYFIMVNEEPSESTIQQMRDITGILDLRIS